MTTVQINKANTLALTADFTAAGQDKVQLIALDESTARHYGVAELAGKTIGGIAPSKAGWAVVAYRDRNHLLNGGGFVSHIPVDARNRAHAARMLALFWCAKKRVDSGRDGATLPGTADFKRA